MAAGCKPGRRVQTGQKGANLAEDGDESLLLRLDTTSHGYFLVLHQGATGMSTVPVFVGLDYHDRSVQVCVLDREGRVLANRSVANDVKEIAQVVAAEGRRVFAAIEACNGSAELAEELIKLGWSVHLAHPGYVARIKQNPDKTDFRVGS